VGAGEAAERGSRNRDTGQADEEIRGDEAEQGFGQNDNGYASKLAVIIWKMLTEEAGFDTGKP
jgi:hypothetical protein